MTKPSFPPDFGVRLANLESRLKELERPQFRAKPHLRDLTGVAINDIADGQGLLYDKDLGLLVPASLALAVHAHDYAATGHTHPPSAVEVWTGADLPTTGNFTGRVVVATGLTSVFFRGLYFHDGTKWVPAAPFHTSYGTDGNGANTNNSEIGYGNFPGKAPCDLRAVIQGYALKSQSGTHVSRLLLRIGDSGGGSQVLVNGTADNHTGFTPMSVAGDVNINANTTVSLHFRLQSDALTSWLGADTGEESGMTITYTRR